MSSREDTHINSHTRCLKAATHENMCLENAHLGILLSRKRHINFVDCKEILLKIAIFMRPFCCTQIHNAFLKGNEFECVVSLKMFLNRLD